MFLRPFFPALLALTLALAGGGCGDSGVRPLGAETDDVVYQEGKQLQRQGRHQEALVAFLRVIERRGEQRAPESHLEAGQIYLQHIKNPVEAIHHFNKYLELQAKSKEAPLVRGLIKSAEREFGRMLPGRVLEDQSQWLNLRDQIERLRTENDQLKQEIAVLRGTAPASMLRGSPAAAPSVMVPPAVPPTSLENSPITPAPVVAAPAGSAMLLPKTPAGSPAKTPGRRHTVAPGETLYRISLKYGVKAEDIVAANRDALPSGGAMLKPGMELKIP